MHVNSLTHQGKKKIMYDMYPEWGPSRHRLDEASAAATPPGPGAVTGHSAGPDLRDDGSQRPDDN